MHEQHYFGFTQEPFAPDLKVEELYQTPALLAATERLLYAARLGAVSLVTGEVGSGKSTCLRYAMSKLHPSQYKVISVIASTGSMIEMLRQICIGLDVSHTINSLSKLAKIIRDLVLETAQRREVPVLVIDPLEPVQVDE